MQSRTLAKISLEYSEASLDAIKNILKQSRLNTEHLSANWNILKQTETNLEHSEWVWLHSRTFQSSLDTI